MTTLAAGRRRTVLSIPTRGDAAGESTESVALRISLDSTTKVATRTVRVLDSR